MIKYDVIVIGGGPAGYHAALKLSGNQKSVLIIEKEEVGGTCLNAGCIPTKSLLYSSKEFMKQKNHSEFDLEKALCKEKQDILNLLTGLKNRLRASGVVTVAGSAYIEKGKEIVVSVDNRDKYTSDYLIIATGSSVCDVQIPGLSFDSRNENVYYSNEFLKLDHYADNIAIIGGGVIGTEIAVYLSQIGKKVTIFEANKKILSGILDEDVRDVVKKSLTDKGIKIIENCHIMEVDDNNIIYQQDDGFFEYSSGQIVVACGRKRNTSGFGLPNIGISEGDFIDVDEHCETKIKHVYACGDVTGHQMLAHAAYKEAEVAVANILNEPVKMEYSAIPSVIYSSPEIAVAGFNEERCISDGISIIIKKLPMSYCSRYLIENGKKLGICKLIFNEEQEIIGAQMVADGSSELIFSVADMIARKCKITEIQNMIFPHPSLSEIIKETVCS